MAHSLSSAALPLPALHLPGSSGRRPGRCFRRLGSVRLPGLFRFRRLGASAWAARALRSAADSNSRTDKISFHAARAAFGAPRVFPVAAAAGLDAPIRDPLQQSRRNVNAHIGPWAIFGFFGPVCRRPAGDVYPYAENHFRRPAIRCRIGHFFRRKGIYTMGARIVRKVIIYT